jgi:hypothetical protein
LPRDPWEGIFIGGKRRCGRSAAGTDIDHLATPPASGVGRGLSLERESAGGAGELHSPSSL